MENGDLRWLSVWQDEVQAPFSILELAALSCLVSKHVQDALKSNQEKKKGSPETLALANGTPLNFISRLTVMRAVLLGNGREPD